MSRPAAGGETVGGALQRAAARLAEAGVERPRLDARLLLAAVLDADPAQIAAWPERALAPAAAARFEGLVARRAAREPVSRILGKREFWGLEFELAPATLDPRPETETLVEAVLERCADRDAAIPILDLGTGSGCLLLALLAELPRAFGVGLDRSFQAAAQARENARRLGLAARSRFVVGDWYESLGGEWKVIVSNPPYIIEADIAALAPEVALYDPRGALCGGEDGLDAYRRLAQGVGRRLSRDGIVALEIGAGQADRVVEILSKAGLRVFDRRCDLAGVERCILAGHRP